MEMRLFKKYRQVSCTIPALFLVAAITVCLPASAASGEPSPQAGDSGAIAAEVDAALKIEKRKPREERINALLDRYRNAPGAEADLAVLRLLNAKAKEYGGWMRNHLLEELLLRHWGRDLADMDAETAYEVAAAILGKAEAVKITEEMKPLLESVRRTGERHADPRRRAQAYKARGLLAGLEPNPDDMRRLWRELREDIEAEEDQAYFRGHLATTLLGIADAAEEDAKPELYDAVIERFGKDGTVFMEELVMRAEWAKARLAAPEARFEKLHALVETYKNTKNGFIHRNVVTIIKSMIELAKSVSDPVDKLDRLAATLKETGVAEQASSVLKAGARLADSPEGRVERFRALFGRFRRNTAYTARYDVADSLVEMMKHSPDKSAAFAAAEDWVTQLFSEEGNTSFHPLVRVVDAYARENGDREGKLRFFDAILAREQPHTRDDVLMTAVMRLKSELLDDPELMTAYMSQKMDTARNDKERSRLMADAFSQAEEPEERLTLARALVRRYADSDNPDIGGFVLRALRDIPRYSPDEDLLPWYEKMDAAFSPAADVAGKKVLAQALLRKAELLSAREEKIAVYDRILALEHPFDRDRFQYLKESAVREKGVLLDDPGLLLSYYRNEAAASRSLERRVRYILREAGCEPSREKKARLYAEAEGMLEGSGKWEHVTLAIQALMARAEITEERREAEELLYRALSRLRSCRDLKKVDYYLGRDIYAALIELAPEREEKRRLYDEEIKFFEGLEDFSAPSLTADILLKKFEVMDDGTEKRALLDEAERLLGMEIVFGGLLHEVHLKRAGLADDPAQKLALYDRVLDTAFADDDAYLKALRGKADVLGDESILLARIAEIMKHPRTGSNLLVAIRAADAIQDSEKKGDVGDEIVAAYREYPNLAKEMLGFPEEFIGGYPRRLLERIVAGSTPEPGGEKQ